MRRLRWTIVIACLAALALAWQFWPPASTSGDFAQQVYVWQRKWSPPVIEAAREHGPQFDAVVVLGAEIDFGGDQAKVARADVDYEALKSTGKPVGLALRIASFSGSPGHDGELSAVTRTVTDEMLAQARAAGMEPAELHVDFDCPTSKLRGYAVFAAGLRRHAMPVRLIVTALPSWLGSSGFDKLAAASDGFVLQVHSLERPAHVDDAVVLCDPAAAKKAVWRAARAGKPFTVALPTYGYQLAYGADGQFVGLAAETKILEPPPGGTLRMLSADPVQLAELVQAWKRKRPKLMQGVIWYRLPHQEDLRNWSMPTLQAVMTGRAPRGSVEAVVEQSKRGLYEVMVRNAGDADVAPPRVVELRWQGGAVIAADAIGGYRIASQSRDGLSFAIGDGATRLRPGEQRSIGWVRLNSDMEVTAHVSK